MDRPSWDQIFMQFAQSLAERSTCARAKVGCVVVTEDNHRVLSIGYNGGARGLPNGCDSTEPGKCGCLHAEENALIKMNFNEPSPKKLYTTTSPCVMCAKRIVNAGIKEVIFQKYYRTADGERILSQAGIKYRKFEVPEPEEKYDPGPWPCCGAS